MDIHVFQDSEYKIGNAILELGRLDTLVLTLSKNQGAKDLQQIPDNRGSTLYRLLTDPDNVNLEYLSADLFAVSKKITIMNSVIKMKKTFLRVTESNKTSQTHFSFIIRKQRVVEICINGNTRTSIDRRFNVNGM